MALSARPAAKGSVNGQPVFLSSAHRKTLSRLGSLTPLTRCPAGENLLLISELLSSTSNSILLVYYYYYYLFLNWLRKAVVTTKDSHQVTLFFRCRTLLSWKLSSGVSWHRQRDLSDGSPWVRMDPVHLVGG